uniref:cytochrome P450 2B10-like n=1 Tax=Styela clava TaxID=7725 RepID=UPI00193AB8A7|nr:cytochrome P450 2B10-like [Styela clava]XP_039265215.1 cytochrome P450 2B10-like [Styela clava]XP_039265216.1 cytochrome P450 2B10-like [Styela clava]
MEVMVRQGQKFSERPQNYVIQQIFINRGFVFVGGESWQTIRKFGNSVFRALGVGKRTSEKIILNEIDVWLEKLNAMRSKPHCFDLDILKLFCNITCQISLGKKYDDNDKIFKYTATNVTADSSKGMLLNAGMTLPFLKILPPVKATLNQVRDDMHELIDYIGEEINDMKSVADPNEVENVAQAFFKVKREEKQTRQK